MLAITVRVTVKALYEDRFLARVVQQAADSLQHEPDCRQFDVCQDINDARRVFLYEIYRNETAFAEHLKTPHFLAFDRETKEWIEEKVVDWWLRSDARDA